MSSGSHLTLAQPHKKSKNNPNDLNFFSTCTYYGHASTITKIISNLSQNSLFYPLTELVEILVADYVFYAFILGHIWSWYCEHLSVEITQPRLPPKTPSCTKSGGTASRYCSLPGAYSSQTRLDTTQYLYQT
jgi:hypothetical protein